MSAELLSAVRGVAEWVASGKRMKSLVVRLREQIILPRKYINAVS